jgi:hypothetical protein
MRKQIAVIAFFLLLGLGTAPVMAQRKVSREAAVWPEFQLDYVFKSTSFLLLRNNYRHVLDNDFNYLRDNGALQYLSYLQFRLGYEHVFNSKWGGGINESYAIERTRNMLFHEVFVRHTSMIGKFRLLKRCSVEHLMRWPKNDNGRFRFRADLDRTFKVGQKTLRPRVASELFFNVDYYPEANAGAETRLVDRSRIRLECQTAINHHFTLSPYFMRQTDYFIVEPAFDEHNQTIRPGGKQNHITPIWGVELRFALFDGGQPFPRSLPGAK